MSSARNFVRFMPTRAFVRQPGEVGRYKPFFALCPGSLLLKQRRKKGSLIYCHTIALDRDGIVAVQFSSL